MAKQKPITYAAESISYGLTFHLGDSNFEKLSMVVPIPIGGNEDGAYAHAREVIERNKKPDAEVFAMLSSTLKPLPKTPSRNYPGRLLPTNTVRLEYEAAVAAENEFLVNQLETLYDFKTPKED